ncbi:hypothetical protein E4O93_05420 [Diaphorobacter sp. DS2]|nr:hypothetical protein E4O93_05420 [Diaphorobacter sp. DS2]
MSNVNYVMERLSEAFADVGSAQPCGDGKAFGVQIDLGPLAAPTSLGCPTRPFGHGISLS